MSVIFYTIVLPLLGMALVMDWATVRMLDWALMAALVCTVLSIEVRE